MGWAEPLLGVLLVPEDQTPVLNLPFFASQFLHLLNGRLDRTTFKDLSCPRGHGDWG